LKRNLANRFHQDPHLAGNFLFVTAV